MPNIQDRPYVGTWRNNRRSVVKYTPDALVYVNGDTSIPGCATCNGRIDIQPFVKGISVEASTLPGGHSASIQLNVPRVYGQSLFVDGKFTIRPTLEIHIYFKGWFPVSGMYDHLGGDETQLPSNAVEAGDTEATNVENVPSYPYYHAFHGVITQVNHDYADGFYTATIACGSMLHFWQYQTVAVNGAAFGTRPRNSNVKMSLIGHNMSGMTPYGIIYMLYKDTAGAVQGVNFALSDKTNNNAASQITGRSLYSMSMLYWERRFKQSMYSLRMHGTSGKLFNGAQQAFLGSARTQDLKRILKGAQYADGQKQHVSRDAWGNYQTISKRLKEDGQPVSDRTVADQVGLTRQGLDVVFSEQASESEMGLNVLDAQAFVSDVSNWGNVSLWESEYETKLDIAHKVTQVTGFEFYQDVDGDMVFKPPFYNMDTSGNRVYRIEDIDIINFNVMEKEPVATMVTLKGAQFKNLVGLGLDNAWGKRGQYIDYRLVAQFGWRPHNMDVTYFNNPRSLFYAAVNKLDLINIDVNSATLTIPIRPEIRPGYPVYIAFIDSFYYVTAFSHSFMFGGQCTTTMTLTARRSKFYAPGKKPDNGPATIDSIQLNNPYLPPTPLIVQDNAGLPRLSGFPNVVMALDPDKTNPKFSILRRITTDDIVEENLAALDTLIDEILQGDSPLLGPCDDNPEAEVAMKDGPWCFQTDNNTKIVINKSDFRQNFQETFNEIIRLRKTIAKNQEDLENAKINRKARKESKADAALTANIDSLNAILNDKTNTVNVVIQYHNTLHSNNDVQGRGNLTSVKDPTSTAAYLDMLGDRKASFVSDSFPGYYRYYSASHPSPDYQGMKKMEESEGTSKSPTRTLKDNNIASVTTPSKVEGYLNETAAPRNETSKSSTTAPARLGQVDVKRGILVSGARGSSPVVRPTHLIQTIAFSPILASKVTSVLGTTLSDDFNLSHNDFQIIERALVNRILDDVFTPPTDIDALLDETVEDTFLRVVGNINQVMIEFVDKENGKTNARTKFTTEDGEKDEITLGFDSSYFTSDPLDLPTGSSSVRNKSDPRGVLPNSEYKTNDGVGQRLSKVTIQEVLGLKRNSKIRENRGRKFKIFGGVTKRKQGEKATKRRVGRKGIMKNLARYYAKYIVGLKDGDVAGSLRAEITRVMAIVSTEDTKGVSQFFNELIIGLTAAPLVFVSNKKGGGNLRRDPRVAKQIKKLVTRPTPVFPVSDEQGYEVIGSYRYGRGIGVEPGGSMQQIYEEGTNLMVDVFERIDAENVELFLLTLQRPEVQNRAFEILRTDRALSVQSLGDQPQNIKRNESAALASAVIEQYKLDGNQQALEQFVGFSPTGETIPPLRGLDLSPKQNAWVNGFANSIVTGQEMNFKLPVVNNSYLLRDIQNDMQVNQKGMCECRAAEADIQLEAFGKTGFLSLEGSSFDDAAVKFNQEQMLQRSILWSDNKNALGGSQNEDPTRKLFDSWQALVNAFETAPARFVSEVRSSSTQVQQAINNLRGVASFEE